MLNGTARNGTLSRQAVQAQACERTLALRSGSGEGRRFESGRRRRFEVHDMAIGCTANKKARALQQNPRR